MSTPPTQPHPLLQPGPFRERLMVYLLPYILPLTDNFDLARTVVLETLASYGARTQREMINAARIIAFSFTSLDVLAEAKAGDIPYELRMRCRSSANALNRSCQQIEVRFDKSLARDPPSQPEANAEPPSQFEPVAESVAEPPDDSPETEFEAALQYAQAKIQAHRKRLEAARPATLPQAEFASQQLPATPRQRIRDHPK